jgi:hypothetical protein
MQYLGELIADIVKKFSRRIRILCKTDVADNTMDMWNLEDYVDLTGNEDSCCATCALSMIATDVKPKYRCKNTRSTEISDFWLCSVNKGRNSRVNSR